MSKSALIILSEGFEDIEAVAPIDILTRSGVEVWTAGLKPEPVAGAYGTLLIANATLVKDTGGEFDALILPGGLENAERMAQDEKVVETVRSQHRCGKLVAAICASSALVLGESCGILRGKRATGYPGFNDRLAACGAVVTGDHVTVDGNIITGMGPGAAVAFALQIAECLVGREIPNDLAARWRVVR